MLSSLRGSAVEAKNLTAYSAPNLKGIFGMKQSSRSCVRVTHDKQNSLRRLCGPIQALVCHWRWYKMTIFWSHMVDSLEISLLVITGQSRRLRAFLATERQRRRLGQGNGTSTACSLPAFFDAP